MASPPEAERETELRPRTEAPAPERRTYEIEVLEGPDVGARATLDAGAPSRLLLGQSPACAFRLTDPAVSRRHLALEVTERGVRLTDLESTNGTLVNGLAVNDVHLAGGETIRIGASTLLVRPLDAASSVPLPTATAFGRMVGASLAMRRLYPLCERVAASDVPVVIEGETGTGKEVLAEALFETGPRAGGPFVVFDCTSVPPELFESALFGHEKGAFTGAAATRRGAFELAHGGTLFIDEVGDLAPSLQPKLLRAIERSEVQRVGSERWNKVDVRIIAATRRDLEGEIAAGRFRDDLFFRLSVARIELPPLRRRGGDVTVLARHFWRALGGRTQPFPEDFIARFAKYAWPGNVRELRNAVARRLALGELANAPPVSAEPGISAPSDVAGGDVVEALLSRDLPFPIARREMMSAFEQLYVERVLARHGGNIRKAASASGIARRYFQIIRARGSKDVEPGE